MAGPFKEEQARSDVTIASVDALQRTLEGLRTVFTGRLSESQLDSLVKLNAANRSSFEQKIEKYAHNLDPLRMSSLARAYYSGYREAKFGEFKLLMRTYALTIKTKELDDLIVAIAGGRQKNQDEFIKLIKGYNPALAPAAESVYHKCSRLYAVALIGVIGEKQPGEASQISNEKKLKEILGELRKTVETYINYGDITRVEGDELSRKTIQRMAEPLNNEQRKKLFDLALAVGFASSVVDVVQSYFSFMPQTSVDTTQTSKIAMQSVVERIRSVDELAKQKLEELREEDAGGKKLGAEEKRKKLREDAEKMLMDEEEGKKPAKKAPEPADLEQVTSIRNDMHKEVRLIESARNDLVAKMPLEKAFNDPKFEEMFEEHRSEEVKETRKYFQTGMVPVKVLDAIANIRPPDVASYGPVSQLALLRAYRKTLQEYGKQAKAG